MKSILTSLADNKNRRHELVSVVRRSTQEIELQKMGLSRFVISFNTLTECKRTWTVIPSNVSPTGVKNAIAKLYNHRAVERLAWERDGGPDEFEIQYVAILLGLSLIDYSTISHI